MKIHLNLNEYFCIFQLNYHQIFHLIYLLLNICALCQTSFFDNLIFIDYLHFTNLSFPCFSQSLYKMDNQDICVPIYGIYNILYTTINNHLAKLKKLFLNLHNSYIDLDVYFKGMLEIPFDLNASIQKNL